MRESLESIGVSKATAVVALVAVFSGALVALGSANRRGADVVMWTFALHHKRFYDPVIAEINAANGADPRAPGAGLIELQLLSRAAIERRMLSAFLGEAPVADLIEIERQPAASAFRGPLDSVGFVDLTDRLRSEGLLDLVAPASFSPWTSRGRIFGLPHDVHPVMLGYRADLVEGAGIDVSRIETWDDFFEAMRPLAIDLDGDGERDRFALSLWETHNDQIEVLILQAGGAFIDESGSVVIDSERNAFVLASIVSWCVGPDALATDVPEFTAAGNAMKLRGRAVASFFPDWMCNVWRNELPQLSGKMKLMPLPAWERGGRRTSVWGGTMLGISRASVRSAERAGDGAKFDRLWSLSKALYFSPEMARTLYTEGDIVSPVVSNWSDPIYDRPDEYFGGQAKGRMYIGLIPQVPLRNSSAFNTMAQFRVRDAAVALADWARETRTHDRDALLPRAREELREAAARVQREMNRNVFLREHTP